MTATSGAGRRFLLIDVDGTLLDSRGRVSPRSREALARAVRAGLTLVLATGRTSASLQRITAGLDVPYYPITNGGAVGLSPDGRRTLHLSAMEPALWPRIAAALAAEGLDVAVFRHRHPDPPRIHVASPRGDPHFEAYLGRQRGHVVVDPGLLRRRLAGVIQVAALGTGERFEAASARVQARFAGEAETHSMVLFIDARYGRITEFFAPGTTKWHAFLAMFPGAARRPERVIAIGDEANDREMIARAGLGIAMGNAPEALKAIAHRVTADHDHEGLARALEPLLDELEGRPAAPAGERAVAGRRESLQ